MVLGFKKYRKALHSYSLMKDNKKGAFYTEEIVLTLAGFSVTAIALIVSIRFQNLALVYSIVSFFSISFVVLALSWNLMRFQTETWDFISSVLADLGILSLGCGFFVFFFRNLSVASPEAYIIFGIFLWAFFGFRLYDLRKRASNTHDKTQKKQTMLKSLKFT